MVLFGTVRANGQVIWPLVILFVSLYPVRLGVAIGLRDRLGSDALWISFPVAMLATLAMATALYLHGGWQRASDMRVGPPPDRAAPETQAVTAETPVPATAAPPIPVAAAK